MATSRPSRFPRVPYAAIRWRVGELHVGTADADVASFIESRMLAWLHSPRGFFRPSEIREARRYALQVHEDNRREYARVMGGM